MGKSKAKFQQFMNKIWKEKENLHFEHWNTLFIDF